MLTGAMSYFIVARMDLSADTRQGILSAVAVVQPLLLFCMLLLTFCKIRIKEMSLCRWQIWALVFQSALFVGLACLLMKMPHSHWTVIIESAMLCFICPTATAGAVVTGKLGGNAGSLTAYTVMINMCTSILVPVFVPLALPDNTLEFFPSLLLILGKVFPLLICPLIMAVLLRKLSPSLVKLLTAIRDLPFYLWAVSLALAIAVTVRTMVHSTVPIGYMAGIALTSLAACIVQFAFGRWIGRKYGEPISAAQSCGQKNTVFAIWMGYTFMSPITSVAGGFYSIWHNLWNSWQLARAQSAGK